MKDIPALLEQNLRTLEKSQPKLAARLRQYMDELPALREPVFRETPAGRWVEGLTEKPFFEKKSLLEKRSKADPSAVYLVFGTGCAPYLFHVLRSLPREALSVVVIEPSLDLLLLTLSQTSVFQALPQGARISFIVNNENQLFEEVLAWNIVSIGIFPVRNANVIVHSGEESSCDFKLLEKKFHEEIRYRLNMLGNSPEDTLLGFRHAALNIRHILRSPRLSDFHGMYEGKPFVCVASGPSLVKNEHLLHELKNHCVIVACDTVLHHLLEMGIVPHVVTTLERAYSNYPAWVPAAINDYPEECKKILLLSQSVSYPLIAGRWPGPNIVVGKREVPVDNWFVGGILQEQLMYSGLSVAHMSLSFSLLCGASSVALIGQDLAYADEGHSHAPNTAPLSAIKREEERGRFPIEGALGGKVMTNHMWQTFLQLFERIISAASVPVLDCTEGGALIKGTVVKPFADFINENVHKSCPEAQRFDSSCIPGNEKTEAVLTRINSVMNQFDGLEANLDEMERGIDLAVSPALLPEKRREYAFRVAGMIDRIHALNPVISFIGQSYTHLSGATLAETRFLETVEQVRKWETLHREIIASHRSALSFLRQWTHYAERLLCLENNDDLQKEYAGNGESLFEEFYSSMLETKEGVDRTAQFFQLTDILSDKDPIRENWSPENLWKAAKLLHFQGRHDDARRFMQQGYSILEGRTLEVEQMGEFFKDWGDMTGSPDLCVMTDYQEALTYLDNAARFAGKDIETIHILKDRILSARAKLLDGFSSAHSSQESGDNVYLLGLKIRAERALFEQDIPRTFSLVEKLAWESLDSFPGTAIPHLQWLIKTAVDCLQAADTEIVSASQRVLKRVVDELPRLKEKRISFPVEFFAYMAEKGIKFSMDPSDNQTEDR